jgi:hypothetical protein
MVAAPYVLLGLFLFMIYRALKKAQSARSVPPDGQAPGEASPVL